MIMENFNYKGYRANNILKSFGQLQDIMKGGVGSGRKIGSTKSGKSIYDKFEHEGHKDFTSNDHKDAEELHYKKFKKNNPDPKKIIGGRIDIQGRSVGKTMSQSDKMKDHNYAQYLKHNEARKNGN